MNGTLPKIKGYEKLQKQTGTDDIGVFSDFSTSRYIGWWSKFTPAFSEALKWNLNIVKELQTGKSYADFAKVEYDPLKLIVSVHNFSTYQDKFFYPKEFLIQATINYDDPVTIEGLEYIARDGVLDGSLDAIFNI